MSDFNIGFSVFDEIGEALAAMSKTTLEEVQNSEAGVELRKLSRTMLRDQTYAP